MAMISLLSSTAAHVAAYAGHCHLRTGLDDHIFGAATPVVVAAQLLVVGVMTLDAFRRQLEAVLLRRQRHRAL